MNEPNLRREPPGVTTLQDAGDLPRARLANEEGPR